ncbi:hypothetical protein GIB67_000025 [Kingdonia uniflora]|uniref:Uncharacterized protein n=1 Tax=Kingdonia uniflora TaxID=39325 RepID=A0A7J7MP39_9MAGN|nr:hypothetical protein GIB67_000025 [Kingdonia uniflora]
MEQLGGAATGQAPHCLQSWLIVYYLLAFAYAELWALISLDFELSGTLVAPGSRAWAGYAKNTWIVFQGVHVLVIEGSGTGTINGSGQGWWRNRGWRPVVMIVLLLMADLSLLILGMYNMDRVTVSDTVYGKKLHNIPFVISKAYLYHDVGSLGENGAHEAVKEIGADILFGQNTGCKSLLVLLGMFILGVYE